MNNQDLKQQIASGQHYYSEGQYLRAKHQLAGDDFAHWILNHVTNWQHLSILDAGGGWGRFVHLLYENYEVRLDDTVLTDLSEGMLVRATRDAIQQERLIQATVCDIQDLPFADRHFDVVMANKVLYHVPDIPKGISELARVLNLNGYLLASTNSDRITATIIDLHYQALDQLDISYVPETPSTFSMENGSSYLSPYFHDVEQYYYETEEWIDDASQVRAIYVTIGRYRNLLTRDDIPKSSKDALPDTVESIAQSIIDSDGAIHFPTLMGVFVCSRPRIK